MTHRCVLVIAMAFRASGIGPISPECCADMALLELVYELGEIAARGEDRRDRLFGPAPTP
jgi:hypothetical protein